MMKFLFKRREKHLQEDCKIIIPSTNQLFANFTDNIRKTASLVYVSLPEHQSELTSLNSLITKFESVALEALKNSLIETGFKRTKKKFF